MRILDDHRYELQGPLPAVSGEAEQKDLKKKIDPQVLQELKNALREREARVTELETSLSWRITAPVRALGGLYVKMFGK